MNEWMNLHLFCCHKKRDMWFRKKLNYSKYRNLQYCKQDPKRTNRLFIWDFWTWLAQVLTANQSRMINRISMTLFVCQSRLLFFVEQVRNITTTSSNRTTFFSTAVYHLSCVMNIINGLLTENFTFWRSKITSSVKRNLSTCISS
jgi:hypothetical protein